MKALTCAWVFVFVWLCSFVYCLMSGMTLGTAVSDGFSKDYHDPQRMDPNVASSHLISFLWYQLDDCTSAFLVKRLSIGWIARKLGPDIHGQQRMDPNDINDHVPLIPAWGLQFNYWIDYHKFWYIIPRRWILSTLVILLTFNPTPPAARCFLSEISLDLQDVLAKKLTCIAPIWWIIINLTPHVSVAPSWGWS